MAVARGPDLTRSVRASVSGCVDDVGLAGVVAGLVVTACRGGGDGGIDEAALRTLIVVRLPWASQAVIDATVDVVGNACERGDRQTMTELRSEDPTATTCSACCPRQAVMATETTG